MKSVVGLLFLVISTGALAAPLKNTRDDKLSAARVAKLVQLVDKPEIKVNLVIQDLGGTTDVSATQRALFTLYSKGEMFSTDATFDLGPIFSLKKAVRVSGGQYEVTVERDLGRLEVLRIDAVKAINAIKSVSCEDFDCEASEKFSTTIDISSK